MQHRPELLKAILEPLIKKTRSGCAPSSSVLVVRASAVIFPSLFPSILFSVTGSERGKPHISGQGDCSESITNVHLIALEESRIDLARCELPCFFRLRANSWCTDPLLWKNDSSAESIPTLKNRESIHSAFFMRGFVEKESIHESILSYITIHHVK